MDNKTRYKNINPYRARAWTRLWCQRETSRVPSLVILTKSAGHTDESNARFIIQPIDLSLFARDLHLRIFRDMFYLARV